MDNFGGAAWIQHMMHMNVSLLSVYLDSDKLVVNILLE